MLGRAIDAEADDPSGAFVRLEEHLARDRRDLVHPFDDPRVMAGQGTVGLEILEDTPGVDVIAVPVGGGGLIAGIAAAVAPRGVRVVGVEPKGSAALSRALAAGKPVGVKPRTIASGLDAPFAGQGRARALPGERRRGASRSRDDEIEAAMRRLYADVKLACEPAGAAAVAAVLSGKIDAASMVAVVSGGNVGPEIASAILAKP